MRRNHNDSNAVVGICTKIHCDPISEYDIQGEIPCHHIPTRNKTVPSNGSTESPTPKSSVKMLYID